MPKRPGVRFRLRKSASSNLHSIVLHFLYFNRRLYFSTGQFIKSEDWDLKKERVRNKLKTTIDGNFALNDLLDNLEELCLKTFRVLMVDGIPEPIEIKNQLSKFLDKNHKNIEITKENSLFSLAQRFINGEIKNKGKEKSQGSLDNYHAVTEHLKAYKAYSKKRIDFDTIDLNFFYSYVDYLKKVKKLAENTIAKDISIIKVFMGEAVDLGYTDNFAFRNKKFTYSEVETDQIYLNEQELDRIYKHKFSNKKLENTRDLFIFGAWTMLRFSDFTNVKPENIVEIDDQKFIKIITQKTKELVIIPCNPVILEILEKYKDNANSLPKSISNQKFNKYIKDVCKEVGLNEIGRNSDMPLEPLWNLVSAHTCRRSGITNYFLQDFPKYYLQKISGHKTERQFDKYLRVTKLDTAKRLREHIDKIDWTRLLLKATTT